MEASDLLKEMPNNQVDRGSSVASKGLFTLTCFPKKKRKKPQWLKGKCAN